MMLGVMLISCNGQCPQLEWISSVRGRREWALRTPDFIMVHTMISP
jgi:hypothetical protein